MGNFITHQRCTLVLDLRVAVLFLVWFPRFLPHLQNQAAICCAFLNFLFFFAEWAQAGPTVRTWRSSKIHAKNSSQQNDYRPGVKGPACGGQQAKAKHKKKPIVPFIMPLQKKKTWDSGILLNKRNARAWRRNKKHEERRNDAVISVIKDILFSSLLPAFVQFRSLSFSA